MATSAKPGTKPLKSKTAAKPAAKTTAAKPAASKPAPAAKSAVAAKTATTAKPAASKPAKAVAKKSAAAPVLAPEQRRYYVEVAAYYIAERRGFHGGSELDDWINAESEIDRLLREGILNP